MYDSWFLLFVLKLYCCISFLKFQKKCFALYAQPCSLPQPPSSSFQLWIKPIRWNSLLLKNKKWSDRYLGSVFMITGSKCKCPWIPVIQWWEMYNYVEKDIDILDCEACLKDFWGLVKGFRWYYLALNHSLLGSCVFSCGAIILVVTNPMEFSSDFPLIYWL